MGGKDCPHMDLSLSCHGHCGIFNTDREGAQCGSGQSAMQHRRHHCSGPDPADLLSTTSAGSGPTSRGQRLSSLSELLSSPASTTTTTNSLLAGPHASVIKPSQPIQNAAERLLFNLPQYSHVMSLFRVFHLLLVAPSMVLTNKAVNRTAPAYQAALVRPHTPARLLHR